MLSSYLALRTRSKKKSLPMTEGLVKAEACSSPPICAIEVLLLRTMMTSEPHISMRTAGHMVLGDLSHGQLFVKSVISPIATWSCTKTLRVRSKASRFCFLF
ncbi:uncharacterized protein PV09_06573 [Verruconis gallopava]|uniref:Uncharacterized protein n=1 Tax=Verruconis gallopava TaxID=253628 RepID=A0A0D2ASD5_9PEZI|nr:uncharacterized protein PV09_06573 [Verruconis gallopava]KIW02079.1 hypothetical protein PV09_06573 [Verruconis gallopava]